MGAVIEFDYLTRKAAANEAEAEASAAMPLPGEPEPVDEATEIKEILIFARDLLSPIYTYLPAIYTDETIGALASRAVPLMDKYGLTVSGLGSMFAEEIAFAMVAVPLAIMHMQAHKAWRAEQDAARTIEHGEQPAQSPIQPVPMHRVIEDNGGRLAAA